MKYIFSITAFLIIALSLYADTSGEIIIFTQKGCSRCEYAISYLKKNNISYTEYPTEDEANNNKMWSAIQQSDKPDVERITMPVIVKDGEVYFSIEHLEQFVEKLSGK